MCNKPYIIKQVRFNLITAIYGSMVTVFILLLSVSNIFAYPADVKDISGREYYSAVKEVIDNAEKSIAISMYIINLNENNKKSQVYKLCNSLVEAKKRGVDVKIILDQNIDFVRAGKDYIWETEGKNEDAYKYFKKNGIDVFYDDKTTYMHSKAIVVDKEIVITGSTNWSQSALTKNTETSVLIKSTELAKSILDGFSKIDIDNTVSEARAGKDSSLAIYMDFLENENLAGRMITKHDERAFDLYLLLLYTYEDEDIIDFDYDLYAKYLGIDKEMSVEAYRRQIIKTLKKLKKRYKLIKTKFYHGKNAEIKLRDIEDKKKLYKYPKKNYFLLPKEYFKYEWNKRLSFRAKFCYLINRYMVLGSSDKYSWSASGKDLSEKFHLVPGTIGDGMNELRKLNLIDVEQSSIEEGYESREPAKYRVLNLYSSKEQKKIFTQLINKYGKKSLDEAKQYAEIVFKKNDPVVVEDIIKLTKEYGKDKVKKAYDIVAQKAVSNPKRTHRYAVGIIKSLREDELKEK